MRITAANMPAVPLPAAWLDTDGAVLAATPEWPGAGLGVREYRAGAGRRLRLLVAPPPPTTPAPGIGALSERLLSELDRAVPETAPARRVGLRLAVAALGVMAGRGDPEVLTAQEIAEAVVGACRLEGRAPAVHMQTVGQDRIPSGWLVAAALKQIAMNARKHEGCAEAWLRLEAGWMSVAWEGGQSMRALRGVATSRHRDRRSGWGLGMVRLCCDAVGASYLAPREVGEGWVEAAFALEPDSSCLRLPLATVGADGVVAQATRTWDAEAGVVPGRAVTDSDLVALLAAAGGASGRIVQAGPWVARSHDGSVWVALRPADTREQGLDLLEGIAHEAELLVGEPESAPWRRAVAVLETLQMALGRPVPAYAQMEFARDVVRYGEAFGVDLSFLRGLTTPAPPLPPPALTAFLLAAGGGGTLGRDTRGWVVRPREARAAELSGLVAPDGGIRVEVTHQMGMQEVTG